MWRSRPMELVLLLSLAVLPRAGEAGSAALAALPFDYAKDERYADLINQGEAVKYFEERFYGEAEGIPRPALTDDQLLQVDNLRRRAAVEPDLALAAAQVLYMFGWFRSSGEMLRENVVASAELFERSIAVSQCLPGKMGAGDWVENACDIRWMHACLLYNWLGETEHQPELAQAYARKAHELLAGIRSVPQYAEISAAWTSPVMISFNSIIFKGKPTKPIWTTRKVGVGRFLEDNHHIFKAELEAIVKDPRDLYRQLMRADPSRVSVSRLPEVCGKLDAIRYRVRALSRGRPARGSRAQSSSITRGT
eukprot:TRINITY_DN23033_c0_g2_i2.p1 TRINITY_DN23033_c0_g2~~TRINITY_DN23033_c0_g2_i2.p1  ORF type:complete len:348 (+),score=68.50 TRINITY_DN23033_c0_g2_i2:122-1045(+)